MTESRRQRTKVKIEDNSEEKIPPRKDRKDKTDKSDIIEITLKPVSRIKTIFVPNFIEAKEATKLYDKLKDNIEWVKSIRSRREGHTRLGCMLNCESTHGKDLMKYIDRAVDKYFPDKTVLTLGLYLNYYRDGKEFSPNHNHKNTLQIVISLGATRKFILGKKSYEVKNGDMIIFGSSIHGVPKDESVKEGRISIATFSRLFE